MARMTIALPLCALLPTEGVVHAGSHASAAALVRVPPPVAAPRLVPLSAAAEAGLRSAYGLAVVPVPDPPAAPAGGAAGDDCPVEVRAIVAGEGRDAFTVLAWDEESVLLGVGQGVRTRGGWYTVSEIGTRHVMLRHGEGVFRCALVR